MICFIKSYSMMNSVLRRHKYNGFSLKQAYLLQLFHFGYSLLYQENLECKKKRHVASLGDRLPGIKHKAIQHLLRHIFMFNHQLRPIGLQFQCRFVVVDENRKISTWIFLRRDVAIIVRVTAKHDINSLPVQNRQELSLKIQWSVPSTNRGNMKDNNPKRSLFKSIRFNNPSQPLLLLGAVFIESRQPRVLDIGIRLIFAAIQHDKKDGALLKTVIELIILCREIFRKLHAICTPRLVITAREKHGDFRGEQFDRGIHEPGKNILFALKVRSHVPIEKHQVAILESNPLKHGS